MSQAGPNPCSRHLTALGNLGCKQDVQMNSELQTEGQICRYYHEPLPKYNASTAHIKNRHPSGGVPWMIKPRPDFADRTTHQIPSLTRKTKSADGGAAQVVNCRHPVASDVEQKDGLSQDVSSHVSSDKPGHGFYKYTGSPVFLPKPALKRSFPSSPSQPGDNTSPAHVVKRVRFLSPPLNKTKILTPSPTPSPPPRTQPSTPINMMSLETIPDLGLRRAVESPAVSPSPRLKTTCLDGRSLPTLHNVFLDRSQNHGFRVHYFENNIRHTLGEKFDFFINGHKKLKPHNISVADIRCSRWSEKNDCSLSFYCSQLLHRGLPTTADKEVAKWRLYENASRVAKGSGNDQKQRLNAIHNIKLKLQTILEAALPTLERLPRDLGGDARCKWKISGLGDEIEEWMIEEQTSDIEPGEGYGFVLKAWLSARYPLKKAEEGTGRMLIQSASDTLSTIEDGSSTFLDDDLDDEGSLNQSEKMEHHARTLLKRRGSTTSGRSKRLAKSRKEHQRKRKGRRARHRRNSPGRVKVNKDGQAQVEGAEEQLSEEQSKSAAKKEVRKAIERDRPTWIARMMDWVSNKCPELLSQHSRATETGGPRPMSISDICGLYALIPILDDGNAANEQQLHTTAELVLAHAKTDIDQENNGGDSGSGAIYGRFRLGRHIHGLVKIAAVPDKSTTDPIWMNLVIEDPEARDGSWVTEIDDYGAAGAVAVPGEIIFLGGSPGLVILGHETLFGKATRIVFGARSTYTEGEGEGMEVAIANCTALGKGFKESWDSIWGIFRGMNVSVDSENGRPACAVKAGDREVGWE